VTTWSVASEPKPDHQRLDGRLGGTDVEAEAELRLGPGGPTADDIDGTYTSAGYIVQRPLLAGEVDPRLQAAPGSIRGDHNRPAGVLEVPPEGLRRDRMHVPGQHPAVLLRAKRHGLSRFAALGHLQHVGTVADGL
jgi:hypothetical protein